jgi:Peptidase A4 family
VGKLAAVVAVALGVAGAAGGGSTQASGVFAARVGAAGPSQVSSNWSGYAAVPPAGDTVTFTDVTATWQQPKGRCVAGRSDSAGFWVGLGGFVGDAKALEQLGTEVDCSRAGGAPHHSAWWEIVPAGPVSIPLEIAPGDTIAAAVLVDGQTVTFSMRNLTRPRRARFSKRTTVAQPLDVSSAEWVAEAPSVCGSSDRCRVVPLTNFGSITFSNAALTGNAHAGTLVDPTWTLTPIELVGGRDGSSRVFDPGDPLGPGVGAVPGEAGADGRSFTVSWQRVVMPPQTP